MNCLHCQEPLIEGDSIAAFNNGEDAMHRNCMLRGVIGSVAHQERRCSCYLPGSTAGDPPGMTLRQAADAAVSLWESCRRTGEGSARRKCQ